MVETLVTYSHMIPFVSQTEYDSPPYSEWSDNHLPSKGDAVSTLNHHVYITDSNLCLSSFHGGLSWLRPSSPSRLSSPTSLLVYSPAVLSSSQESWNSCYSVSRPFSPPSSLSIVWSWALVSDLARVILKELLLFRLAVEAFLTVVLTIRAESDLEL